ncbi:hypothetical protein C8J57DRAFT_1236912 [Mycena rebaudengoi]|nr:hypothetical protein C8J57DRAFT_1236912 [Mycena rebaudengoi]
MPHLLTRPGEGTYGIQKRSSSTRSPLPVSRFMTGIVLSDNARPVSADTIFELATSILFPDERNRTHTSTGFVFVGNGRRSALMARYSAKILMGDAGISWILLALLCGKISQPKISQDGFFTGSFRSARTGQIFWVGYKTPADGHKKGRNVLGHRITHCVRARQRRDIGVGELKGKVKRNVRNGHEAGRSEISLLAVSQPAVCVGSGGNALPPVENGLRAENETASGGNAEGVSVDGEQGLGSSGDRRAKMLLQKEKETMWNTRRELSYKRGGEEDNRANPQHVTAKKNRKVEEIIVARESHILAATNSSRTTRSSQEHSTATRVVHGGIDELRVTNRSIQRARRRRNSRKRECMSREKARQPKWHTSTLSQQDQTSSEIADIRELHMEKCSKCPLRGTSCTKKYKREPPKFRIFTIEETKKEKRGKDRHSPTKQLPPSTAVRAPGRREQRSRRERTGGGACQTCCIWASGGVVTFVLWCCARCAARSWVVVTEEEAALEVMEGRSSRNEHGSRRVRVCEETVETEEEREGGRRREDSGVRGRCTEERWVWGANKERLKAPALRRSQRWREVRWACAEEEGGEARKDAPGL